MNKLWLAAGIPWITAFKIALVVGIIAGMARGTSHAQDQGGGSRQ